MKFPRSLVPPKKVAYTLCLSRAPVAQMPPIAAPLTAGTSLLPLLSWRQSSSVHSRGGPSGVVAGRRIQMLVRHFLAAARPAWASKATGDIRRPPVPITRRKSGGQAKQQARHEEGIKECADGQDWQVKSSSWSSVQLLSVRGWRLLKENSTDGLRCGNKIYLIKLWYARQASFQQDGRQTKSQVRYYKCKQPRRLVAELLHPVPDTITNQEP